MEKLKMQSHDVIGSNTQKIAQLFPNCVTERLGKDGKPELAIDFEKLQAELSNEIIAEGEERYQFTWPDKRASVRLANTPTTMTLRPCREESVDFDNTQNLYIEGDNLDVLKVLRETYLGKVKMIYIDPPYNTGNDFVYNDDFSIGSEEFGIRSGFFDEEGNQTTDPMQRNTESNGRFHTDWLNMIYPRLKVARDLLSEDGVIFISIDDNEVENLQKICDEIFGAGNKVGLMTLMSNPRGSQNGKHLSYVHEYIFMYTKNMSLLEIKGISKDEASLSEYKEVDNNGRKYRLLGLRKRGGAWKKEDRPNMFYPIYINPDNGNCSLSKTDEYTIEVIPKRPTGELSRWTWGKDKFMAECNVLIGKKVNRADEFDSWDIFRKDYIDSDDGVEKTTKVRTIWDEKETNYQNAKNEIKVLFGNSEMFDYPKPTYIVYKLASMLYHDEGDIVLDFFSGSATTAHAVIKLNAEDGGNRKFIMVQLPEKTDEKSEAYKAGYKNICEIGKERIRRAGAKINEELGVRNEKLDIGFRVLKLDSSNMEDVYYTPQEFSMSSLFNENVKSDRTNEDLLFQVMLDLGIELSVSIRNEELGIRNDITVFNVDDGYLMAIFDKDVDEKTITEIAKRKPVYFVMRDASASNDNVIDNFEQIFKHYSPETTCRVI